MKTIFWVLLSRDVSVIKVGSYDPMPNKSGELLVGLNLDRIKSASQSLSP